MAELKLFGMRWRDETPNWSLGLDSMFRAEKYKISLIIEKKRKKVIFVHLLQMENEQIRKSAQQWDYTPGEARDLWAGWYETTRDSETPE